MRVADEAPSESPLGGGDRTLTPRLRGDRLSPRVRGDWIGCSLSLKREVGIAFYRPCTSRGLGSLVRRLRLSHIPLMGMLDPLVGFPTAADAGDFDLPTGADPEDHAPTPARQRSPEAVGVFETQIEPAIGTRVQTLQHCVDIALGVRTQIA